jgi:CDP-diglyceride synthetase
MGTKSAKIWQRTRVGGLLTVGLALLLWAAAREAGAFVVLAAGALLAIVGVLELHRTGAFGARVLALGVLPATLAVFGLLGLNVIELRDLPLGEPANYGLLTSVIEGDTYTSFLLSYVVLALALANLAFFTRRMYAAREPDVRPLTWAPLAVALWIALPLAWLTVIRLHWGVAGLVALVVLSKTGDIAGYYFGNLLGKTHPFPKISPGKTTGGCVASFLCGSLFGVLCELLGLFPESRFAILSGLLAGAALNLASQAGDLLESVVKRRAGVKDSGTFFGPSGGVLDLVDSLLLSVPMALVVWPLLFAWPV